MKKRLNLVMLFVLCGIGLFSFVTGTLRPEIPKAWDLAEVETMHLPYPDTTARLGFISEENYYKLPVRVSYKTYPFYMPGYEPPGYYDSLMRLEPVVNLN